jgi:hypothetical protein
VKRGRIWTLHTYPVLLDEQLRSAAHKLSIELLLRRPTAGLLLILIWTMLIRVSVHQTDFEAAMRNVVSDCPATSARATAT